MMTNAGWPLCSICLLVLIHQVHSINGGAHSAPTRPPSKQEALNCTPRDPRCHLNTTTTAPKLPLTTQKVGLITRTSDAIYKTLSGLFKHDEDDKDVLGVTPTMPPMVVDDKEFGRRNLSRLRPTTTTTKSPSKIAKEQELHIELDLFQDEPMTTKPPVLKQTTSTRKPNAIKSTSTSTTSAPTTTTTTMTTTTTKRAPVSPQKILDTPNNSTNSNQRETKLYSIINSALQSIYSLSELTYLNRTTRLAHGHESIEIQAADDEAKESGKLITLESSETQLENQNDSKQFATREDIHLLCKLLHKQLENGLVLPNGNLNLTLTSNNNRNQNRADNQQAASKPTMKSVANQLPAETNIPKMKGYFVSSLNDLNESQESRLLESTFALNRSHSSSSYFNESHEEGGQRLLLDLFNLAHKVRQHHQNQSRGESLETSDDESLFSTLNSSSDHLLGLKLWSKSSYGGKGGRLRLVYWLIEPVFRNLSGDGRQGPLELYKIKLVDSREANELLDQLDHSLIKRQLDSISLLPVGDLVRPYKATLLGGEEENSLNVPDDNLTPPIGGPNGQPQTPTKKSGLQRLADRLTNQSFADNVYLYLLMLLILIFLVVLCCFVCPAFCRKQTQPKLTSSSRDHLQSISSISGALKSSGSPTLQLTKNTRRADEEQLRQASDAIWRKLSNSTTTLVKDQTRVLRHDGSIEVPILKERANQTSGDADNNLMDLHGGQSGGFEWYSFESDQRTEEIQKRRRPTTGKNNLAGKHEAHQTCDKQSQTFIISDRRQVTKSVQTYPADADEVDPTSTRMVMSCRDRTEAKSSDTLTKSELIMLKEKLIPIEAQVVGQERSKQQASGSQTDQQRGDYVNTSNITTQTGPSMDEQQPVAPNYVEQRATRYIDSSSSSSDRPSTVIDQLQLGQQQHQQAGGSLSGPASGDLSGARAHSSTEVERLEQLERRPKMRHLELPQKYGSKVEAIKSELTKIEQRDAGSTGTYRRYDVI